MPEKTSIVASGGDPLSEVLSKYDEAKFNLAAPVAAIDELPPFHRVSVRIVRVSEDETYPIPGGRGVGLSKVALDKIAAAAGISWIPERSGQIDDWGDPHHVKYRAVGEVRDFDGTTRIITGEKEIDLRGEPDWPEDQLGSDAREFVRIAKAKGRDPWNQILQQRQHIHSLAESKAKLRAIRSALAIPISMPKSKVTRPWVVPHLVPDLPVDDPEVKRLIVKSMLGEAGRVYHDAPPSFSSEPAPALNTGHQSIEAEEAALQAAVSEFSVDEPEDVDFFVEAEAESDETKTCPLPIPDEYVERVDDERKRYLSKLNVLALRLIQLKGEDAAGEMIREIVDDTDLFTCDLEEIVPIGKALAKAVTGV